MLEWIPSTTPGGAPYAVRLVNTTTDTAAVRVSSEALPTTFTEAGVAQTLWDVDDRLSRIAGGVSLFVNAQRSWACVRRRQHCFRNLDVDYLTIKAFLLERFLHDALYEAPTAEVFNEFLDIRPAPAAQVSFASSPSLPRSAVSGSLSR
jgi:hypothetical protein